MAESSRILDGARRAGNSDILSRMVASTWQDSGCDLSVLLKRELAQYHDRLEAWIARQNVGPDRRPRLEDTAVQLLQPPSSMIVEHILGRPIAAIAEPQSRSVFGQCLARMGLNAYELEVLHHTATSTVYAFARHIILKVVASNLVSMSEVSNMYYVHHRSTLVPTPGLHGVFRSLDHTWMFMDRLRGQRLEEIWRHLTTRQKLSLQCQLNTIVKALRQSQPMTAENGVFTLGGVDSGVCRDARRPPRNVEPSEKITSEMDFNDFLCRSGLASTPASLRRQIRPALRDDHRIVMTHGNLHPRNILVNWQYTDEGSPVVVSGLLGWDAAGWYPEYWEYVKAMTAVKRRSKNLSDWVDYLPTEAMGSYPAEFAITSLLEEVFE